jgi:hypothetical protein
MLPKVDIDKNRRTQDVPEAQILHMTQESTQSEIQLEMLSVACYARLTVLTRIAVVVLHLSARCHINERRNPIRCQSSTLRLPSAKKRLPLALQQTY